MSNCQPVSKAALLLPANSAENEICMGHEAETTLGYLHRTCAASEGLHPRLIPFRPLACTDQMEFSYSVEEVVAAIESGSVHPEHGHLPTMFASTHDFNNFLNEVALLYRRSVDRWGCLLDGTQSQMALNNQTA